MRLFRRRIVHLAKLSTTLLISMMSYHALVAVFPHNSPFPELVLDDMAYEAGSVLLGGKPAEAGDQGVRRGASEAEAMGYYFHLGADDSIDYEQLLTWDENLLSRQTFG
jgi:hypothetical protein